MKYTQLDINNAISEFDPFDDDYEKPVPIAASYNGFDSVEPAALEDTEFTITDIAEQPIVNHKYQAFQWRFFVQVKSSGKQCTFLLNPSQRRNRLIDQLSKNLPIQNMTLVKKNFIDNKTCNFVVYYELASYNSYNSGTISH